MSSARSDGASGQCGLIVSKDIHPSTVIANQTSSSSKKENEKCKKPGGGLFGPTPVNSVIPKNRQDTLKWNGWGYKDSGFKKVNGMVSFTGDRYPIGGMNLPEFRPFVEKTFNMELYDPASAEPMPTDFPESLPCPEFTDEIKSHNISMSYKGLDRLIRSHGQTMYDINTLREGKYGRLPDIVVWPTCHDDVVKIVEAANRNNIVIIPFGGGTSVSGSITCPPYEKRCIVALDTSQMNRLLWVDKENLVVSFESGVLGQDLERVLQEMNLTVGHEPDSYEFSSLGGWVATRASGMKKNVYGNIEDLVVRVKMVTCKGTLERNCSAPRVSIGPDFNQVILGSEGMLGVVTEVVLKVRPLPEAKRYGSLVFPDFHHGVKFMREVARRRCQPSSIRLLDNEQFKFGMALKPKTNKFQQFVEILKHFYVEQVKGFDFNKLCVCTLLMEGTEEEVKRQEKLITEIATANRGFSGGATNGERGYVLTFVIAYIRDFGLSFNIVAESFETSMPWDRCETLCVNVKKRIADECSKLSINHFYMSCRVTQTYDAGACVYFYFGFYNDDFSRATHLYEHVESAARDEVLASGGSLSHHHGIGKLRKRWYEQSVSGVGKNLFISLKKELDPNNVFAVGNLVTDEVEEQYIQEQQQLHHNAVSKL